jgi:hypothetical protein
VSEVADNEPSPADAAPDLIAPLRAWRAWNIVETETGWRLASIHYREEWPVDTPLHAWCYRISQLAHARQITHERHQTPVADCHCGIYGTREPERAQHYFVADWAEPDQAPMPPLTDQYVPRAIGQVDLWGRVLVCEHGYRAAHAHPAQLYLPARRPDGDTYDVESIALDLLTYGAPIAIIDAATGTQITQTIRHAA